MYSGSLGEAAVYKRSEPDERRARSQKISEDREMCPASPGTRIRVSHVSTHLLMPASYCVEGKEKSASLGSVSGDISIWFHGNGRRDGVDGVWLLGIG